jgi:hypothetical protein
MKLLTIIPYCTNDLPITTKLLEWINELAARDIFTNGPLLLAADSAVPRSDIDRLAAIARKSWRWVRTMIVTVPADGWAPTLMFRTISSHVVANYRLPFFWMEPDCIPLVPSWLRQLQDAYEECPKRYMGALISQTEDPALPAVHMTGCGIYPNDAIEDFMTIKDLKTQAWDIASALTIVPRCENTQLIHHFWGLKDLPPVFVHQRLPDSPKNHVTLDFIRKDAAVFHRSKGGELIDLLRQKLHREIPTISRGKEAASNIVGPGGEKKMEAEKGKTIPSEVLPIVPQAAQASVKPDGEASEEDARSEVKAKELRNPKSKPETRVRPQAVHGT